MSNNDNSQNHEHNGKPNIDEQESSAVSPPSNRLAPDRYDEYKTLLSSAKTLEEFKKIVLYIVKNLGFTDYIFIRLDRHWLKEVGYGLLYSVPDELMRIYHDEKLYTKDLLILSTANSVQPLFMSTVYNYINDAPYEIDLIGSNRKIQQLNKRFGFYDHFIMPRAAFNRRGNVQLALTYKNIAPAKLQDHVNRCIPDIRALCKAIDVISTQQFYDSFINYKDKPAKISSRQLTVMSMLANDDSTITDIANRLHISPITAHQHISAARKALGVTTNIAAIKKLVKLEYIQYT